MQQSNNPAELGRIMNENSDKILPNLKSTQLQKQVTPSDRSQQIITAETQLALSKYLSEAKDSVSQDIKSGQWKDSVDYLVDKTGNGDKLEPSNSNKVSRDEYYGRVPEHHLPPVKVLMKDPIFENPNSFESIIEIFRTIIKKNKHREWIIIYSDGVPFLLGKYS